MKSFYYLLFFLYSISVSAKSPQVSTNQVEIYVWGSIFFSISMGSLLLIIHLIPRDKNLSSKSPSLEVENTNQDLDTTPTEVPTTSISDSYPKINLPSELPKAPPYKKPQNIPDSGTACKYVYFDTVFKMRLLDVENICKEFIDRINNVDIQSISLYFIKGGRFVCYLEKKNNIFVEYNFQKEKSDLLENVLSLIGKKLGAFSANHSDAVFPLVHENEIFGAIKLHFTKPSKNTEISSTWREIKNFSHSFYNIYFKFAEVPTEETESSNDSFQSHLSNTYKSKIPQGLCLVKWIKGANSELFLSQLTRKLHKFTKSENKVFQLNDTMYGFILSDSSLESLQDNIGIFMGELILDDPSLEFCIGCATNSSLHTNHNDWYKSALQSLKNAVAIGPNKFNFMN